MTSRRTKDRDVIPESSGIQFVNVDEARLEYLDIPATRPARPEILLLHEGLGSVSIWRDFPDRLARATGCRTIAYSREGFGRSSPRKAPFGPRFVHEEALDMIPRLRAALAIERPVLLGHSTGASMALVHAGSAGATVAGVIAMAPFVDVEDSNRDALLLARRAYETTDWRERLARHHDDVDSVFYGWNDTWLGDDFGRWNLREDLAGIVCPVLVILGKSDEYSTPAQAELIRRFAPNARSFEFLHLDECGHVPHRDQPKATLEASIRLIDAV